MDSGHNLIVDKRRRELRNPLSSREIALRKLNTDFHWDTVNSTNSRHLSTTDSKSSMTYLENRNLLCRTTGDGLKEHWLKRISRYCTAWRHIINMGWPLKSWTVFMKGRTRRQKFTIVARDQRKSRHSLNTRKQSREWSGALKLGNEITWKTVEKQ